MTNKNYVQELTREERISLVALQQARANMLTERYTDYIMLGADDAALETFKDLVDAKCLLKKLIELV